MVGVAVAVAVGVAVGVPVGVSVGVAVAVAVAVEVGVAVTVGVCVGVAVAVAVAVGVAVGSGYRPLTPIAPTIGRYPDTGVNTTFNCPSVTVTSTPPTGPSADVTLPVIDAAPDFIVMSAPLAVAPAASSTSLVSVAKPRSVAVIR